MKPCLAVELTKASGYLGLHANPGVVYRIVLYVLYIKKEYLFSGLPTVNVSVVRKLGLRMDIVSRYCLASMN